MKKLNKKVFVTIFSILSFFLILGIIIYNLQDYKEEYDGISRSLSFIDDFKHEPTSFNSPFRPDKRELDNAMIMDYEVYTIKLGEDGIERIIGHSELESDFDVETIALSIMDNDHEINIGNLYNCKYVYNYELEDTIVLINVENINKKLTKTLIESLIVFMVVEVIIYFISKIITKWITKPAIESFNKQKEFIADASHELKTPLAVIMASSDELKSDKKNSKYIENIKYESDRMNTLIKSLLDLSKLENGVSISTYKDENISKIIERVSLTFEGIAFEENTNIKTNIEKDIIFKCSKEEIEKLISIILDNAIKHSYKNKDVIVNLKKDKNNINIEIINYGDPIKPGDEEKIFERFYRADKSRNRESNRYGLGLAIAKNIVANHNGTIKAFSKDTKTTFKIILKK